MYKLFGKDVTEAKYSGNGKISIKFSDGENVTLNKMFSQKIIELIIEKTKKNKA